MPFDEKKPQLIKEHSINMENRESLVVEGVDDVEIFSEAEVVLITTMGKLTVKGQDLHINMLNVDNGGLSLAGRVNSMEYTDVAKKSEGGFLSRLFK